MCPESSNSPMRQFEKQVIFLTAPHPFAWIKGWISWTAIIYCIITHNLWKFQTRYKWDIYFETTKTLFPVRGVMGGLFQQGALKAPLHVSPWFATLVPASVATVTYFYLCCRVCIVILWQHRYFKNFGSGTAELGHHGAWLHLRLTHNGCLIPLQYAL